jgi:hypothetical protein
MIISFKVDKIKKNRNIGNGTRPGSKYQLVVTNSNLFGERPILKITCTPQRVTTNISNKKEAPEYILGKKASYEFRNKIKIKSRNRIICRKYSLLEIGI